MILARLNKEYTGSTLARIAVEVLEEEDVKKMVESRTVDWKETAEEGEDPAIFWALRQILFPNPELEEEDRAAPGGGPASVSEEEDSLDDDDIPLVQGNFRGGNDVVEISDDDDESIINLAGDLAEYQAPIENLQCDCLTQQFQDDLEEEEETEAGGKPEGGIEEEDADSRDSEVIGPSPQKQPSVFVRTPRLSVGITAARKSLAEEKSDQPEVQPVDQKLQDLVNRAVDIRDKLFRSRNFHKQVSNLIQNVNFKI